VTDGVEVTLAPWPLEAARRLVAGLAPDDADTVRWHPDHPSGDVVDALALALGAYEVDGRLTEVPPWWVHEIRYAGEVVGEAGFHGPPAADGPVEVEIGYSVVPALQGQGIGTRACALLLTLAWRAGADTVLAVSEPENGASRTVLHRCGFRARADGGFAVARPVAGAHW